MLAGFIPQAKDRHEGKFEHMPWTANGALPTTGDQWKTVQGVPALRVLDLAIPALRREEDGSACT